MVEVLAAIALLTIVVLAAERGAIFVLQSASFAREHSEATSLVTQTVAQADGLGFNNLWTGLDPSTDTLSQDPHVTTSGTTYILKLDNATIGTCATTNPGSPLGPHITTVVDAISYQVAVYPIPSGSCASLPPANATVTLVVIVNWKSAVGGQGQVVADTVISAPQIVSP